MDVRNRHNDPQVQYVSGFVTVIRYFVVLVVFLCHLGCVTARTRPDR